MADTVRPIMPAGLPSDLQGIYRLMGYQDDYNYDDEKYATQYAAALELLRTAIGGGEGGAVLPTVSASDNGKVLKVVGGAWAVGTDNDTTELPAVTATDNGKTLKVVEGVWAASN